MIAKEPRNVLLLHYVSLSFYTLYDIAFKCLRQYRAIATVEAATSCVLCSVRQKRQKSFLKTFWGMVHQAVGSWKIYLKRSQSALAGGLCPPNPLLGFCPNRLYGVWGASWAPPVESEWSSSSKWISVLSKHHRLLLVPMSVIN